MSIWDLCIQQLERSTAPKRLQTAKSLEPDEASTLGDVFEQDGLADRPAPAGGLVPPTLATGLPGVGPALGESRLWLDRVKTVAGAPGIQTLPEFRRTVAEWMQRHSAQLPGEATLRDMLCELLDLSPKQLEAQQKKQRDDRKRAAQADGHDDAWLNPLAHHRFGPPLQTAQSDDTASRDTEIGNLRETLKAAQAPHRLRAVFYANLLCVHLAVRADAPSGSTPAVVHQLLRTATRLLQAIALHTHDDLLGDNAAAIASELARQQDAGNSFPTIGGTSRTSALATTLPRPFRPRCFGSPDSLLLTARHALDPEHHAWLQATAWLARDTAHLVTCGLLAPRLQLLGAEDGLLIDGLARQLFSQKEKLRKARHPLVDGTDAFQQVLAKPMYLHRVWQHLHFLQRARHALCTSAQRLPHSPLASQPAPPEA